MSGYVSQPYSERLDQLIADGVRAADLQAALADYPSIIVDVESTGVAETDTANLVAAIAALPSTGGTIRLDDGPYALLPNQVNLNKPVHLLGQGPSAISKDAANPPSYPRYLHTGTLITCNSSTGAAIRVNADGCTFEKLAILNTSSTVPTAGQGIYLETLGRATRFVDLTIASFWINIEIADGYEWFILNSHFYDAAKYSIRLNSLSAPDACDAIISGCQFINQAANRSPTAAIQWESGGGLKIVGTKINAIPGPTAFVAGINFAVADFIDTSVICIAANSIENVDYAILFTGSGLLNTGKLAKIAITGNQITAGILGIAIAPTATGVISSAAITGNVGNGSTAFVFLQNCNNVVVANNTTVSGPALSVTSTCTNILMDGYSFATASRPNANTQKPGSTYYDTDLGKMLVSNGSNWELLGGGSSGSKSPFFYSVNGKSPVAAWIPSIDDGSNLSSTLTDLVGSRDGTLTDMDPATDWVSNTGSGGVRSLAFDGTNDFVNCGIISELDGATKATVSGWIYRASTGTTCGFGGVAGSITGSAPRFSFIWFTDGNLYCTHGVGIKYASVALSGTGWHHIMAVFDGTQTGNSNRLKIYIDGALASPTYVGAVDADLGNCTPFCLGRDSLDRFCGGEIDDVRIFDQALTPADAQYLASSRGRLAIISQIPEGTPPASSSLGTPGAMLRDANYLYICTATNTWERVAISTW